MTIGNEILARLEALEYQFKHICTISSEINKTFSTGIKVSIDANVNKITSDFRGLTEILRKEMISVNNIVLEINKQIEADSVIGTLQFMAKAIHEMRLELNKINENGIKKDIQLAFTLDGYEMVRSYEEKQEIIGEVFDDEESLKQLLNSINPRESQFLCFKLGLLDSKKYTTKKMSNLFNLSSARINQIIRKAIRKLAHRSRKHLVDKITHTELKKEILKISSNIFSAS